MRRRVVRMAVLLALVSLMLAQSGTVKPTSAADITGDAATHQLATSGQARWVLFIAQSGNAAVVRIGDSQVSISRGAPISAGAGLLFPALGVDQREASAEHLYDLSAIYYYAATGDKLSVLWAK
jgi:hypothetical protein